MQTIESLDNDKLAYLLEKMEKDLIFRTLKLYRRRIILRANDTILSTIFNYVSKQNDETERAAYSTATGIYFKTESEKLREITLQAAILRKNVPMITKMIMKGYQATDDVITSIGYTGDQIYLGILFQLFDFKPNFQGICESDNEQLFILYFNKLTKQKYHAVLEKIENEEKLEQNNPPKIELENLSEEDAEQYDEDEENITFQKAVIGCASGYSKSHFQRFKVKFFFF